MRTTIEDSVCTRWIRVADASGFRPGDILKASSGETTRHGHLLVEESHPHEQTRVGPVHHLLIADAAYCAVPDIACGDIIEVDWTEMARREHQASLERLYVARGKELEAERTGRSR